MTLDHRIITLRKYGPRLTCREIALELAIPETRVHTALRLCGRLPYSHSQVLPVESAAVIFRLLAIIRELQGCRGIKKRIALEQTVASQRKELLRLWRVESEYNTTRDAQSVGA